MANIIMHMELRPEKPGEKLAWDLKAGSMVSVIADAKKICEEHNRKFSPHDVLVWQNTRTQKSKLKDKPVAPKEKKA